MTAYYNENDPGAAAWLRELIEHGHIAPGDVDERSILDVKPIDLAGYAQCHFFAGIGGWSHALRLAGVSDDTPLWTGSCPCQPFSAAGKGGGFDDERHLWPAWFHLISQCRPATILGEQVASKDGRTWFDLVSSDLEGVGYTAVAADLCAAGVGAPHIRQRLYFAGKRLADGNDARQQGRLGMPERPDQRALGARGVVDGVEHGTGVGRQQRRTEPSGRGVEPGCTPDRMADMPSGRTDGGKHGLLAQDGSPLRSGHCGPQPATDTDTAHPTNGHWRDADWLGCRDGKFRPVEPGTFPLANGVPERVGLLRGYGNAIVPQVAQAFIEAVGVQC